MCLIFLSIDQHPVYGLVIAGNRDEFYARRTAPARFWDDQPNLLGGRDLEGGGTWLGVTRSGRIGLVTNYRDLRSLKSVAPSRGHLVTDFLTGDQGPAEYLREIRAKGSAYNGYNLIVGSAQELWYQSNVGPGLQKITPGLHGLSNHLLDTPWPKVKRGEGLMKSLLDQQEVNPDRLLDALYDEHKASDDQLPDTGVGLERERVLSPMFIKSPGYGSRCSTVVRITKTGHVYFSERVYDLTTFQHETRSFEFDIHES